MTTKATKRTITLTNRPPVRISDDDWPVLAEASDDSYSGADPSRHRQARDRGEVDTYMIKVRRHEDGRAIVYAVLDAAIRAWGQPAGGESRRGGEILVEATPAGTIAAIRRVGADCQIPDRVIRDCIADLPAEDL